MVSRKETEAELQRRPEVIADFDYSDGLLFATLANVGSSPAYRISVKFDKRVGILGGERKLAAVSIFKRLQLLAPGKKLSVFLDSFGSYVGRGEPLELKVSVSYYNSEGRRFAETINHDLSIYKDFTEVIQESR